MNKIFPALITSLLAVFGSLARILSQKDKIAVTFSNIVSGCFVAAFSGVLAHFVSRYFGLDANLSYIFAGVCGWVGPQVLDVFTNLVTKKTGISLKPGEEQAQEPQAAQDLQDDLDFEP